MSGETSTKLRAAFERLRVLPERRNRLSGVIAPLVPLAGKNHLARMPRFSRASHGTSNRQLAEVLKKSLGLADTLDALREPAIVGLASRGLISWEWSKQLRQIAELITTIDLTGVPDKPPTGRPEKLVAGVVAQHLKCAYEMLTGSKASIRTGVGYGSKAYGPFLSLVTEVFKILSIDASPEAMARAALDKGSSAKTSQ